MSKHIEFAASQIAIYPFTMGMMIYLLGAAISTGFIYFPSLLYLLVEEELIYKPNKEETKTKNQSNYSLMNCNSLQT